MEVVFQWRWSFYGGCLSMEVVFLLKRSFYGNGHFCWGGGTNLCYELSFYGGGHSTEVAFTTCFTTDI